MIRLEFFQAGKSFVSEKTLKKDILILKKIVEEDGTIIDVDKLKLNRQINFEKNIDDKIEKIVEDKLDSWFLKNKSNLPKKHSNKS